MTIVNFKTNMVKYQSQMVKYQQKDLKYIRNCAERVLICIIQTSFIPAKLLQKPDKWTYN